MKHLVGRFGFASALSRQCLEVSLTLLMVSSSLLTSGSASAVTNWPDHFGTARILAARMVRAIAPEALDVSSLEEPFREDVKAWYKKYRGDLLTDIQVSKHIWVNMNPNGACGQTDHSRGADINLSYVRCNHADYDTFEEAAKFLIGESAHHLPPGEINKKVGVVGDEYSDWVKTSVFTSWAKLETAKVASFNQDSTQIGAMLPGAYRSYSFGNGAMLINRNLRPIMTADKRAYPGVEVGYQFEGTFAWSPQSAAYVAYSTMGFTGSQIYNIGDRVFRGPYYCEIKVWFVARPLRGGKVLNITVRRPARIVPKDCVTSGVVDEHFAFLYVGQYQGAW